MYNPSRGGVRGGADQFTWESVKNDKHRENYLGHSLKAPVGRWQKGKDLSWYAKERKDADAANSDKAELTSIKRAEEEAMLIALGHNIVRKETQKMSKEEMQEALRRKPGENDDLNIERIDGVGASNKRLALLSNAGNNFKQKSEGVAFEGYRDKQQDASERNERTDISKKERKKSKKVKKHKKEKKHKKHRKEPSDSDSSENIMKHKMQCKKSKPDSDFEMSPKVRHHKKSKHKHKDSSSDNSRNKHHIPHRDKKRHRKEGYSSVVKRRRHDSSESD